MEDTKWTKGEWKVREDGTGSGEWVEVFVEGPYFDDDSEFVVAKGGGVRSKPDGKKWVASEDAEEHTANAYLIAAAPELYEALQYMVDSALELSCEFELRAIQRALQAAKEALAKARGE